MPVHDCVREIKSSIHAKLFIKCLLVFLGIFLFLRIETISGSDVETSEGSSKIFQTEEEEREKETEEEKGDKQSAIDDEEEKNIEIEARNEASEQDADEPNEKGEEVTATGSEREAVDTTASEAAEENLKSDLIKNEEDGEVGAESIDEVKADKKNLPQVETGLSETKIDTSSVEMNKNEEKIEQEEEGEEKKAEEVMIVISEVCIGDEGGTKNDFIELYNFSQKEFDLKDFSLKKKTKSGSESSLVSSGKFSGKIGPESFFVIKNRNYVGDINFDLEFSGSSYSIAKDNRIFLYDGDENLVDSIGWGNCDGGCDQEILFELLKEGQSLSRRQTRNFEYSSAKSFETTSFITPGVANVFSQDIQYPSEIYFNEILANPEGLDKNFEWIEFKNKEKESIDLVGWSIENGSGKRFRLDSFIINQFSLKVIYLKGTSFVVRNSNEILTLINPAGKSVDSIEITGTAPSGVSFGMDFDRGWSWNREVTPGFENRINQLPKVKIIKKEKIYKDIYAEFDASKSSDADGDDLKFVWDFGDGHRSYLKKTKHRYKKKGNFELTLTVSDGIEKVNKKKKIEVKSFPRNKLRFISIVPNPQGKDRGSESIEIENLSSKKVNLLNYYISSGSSSSSLVRHKINKDFVLLPGQSKIIFNSKICLFSLTNKKGKVKLLSPDGEKVASLRYQKDKIEDGEKYEFENDVWNWKLAKKEQGKAIVSGRGKLPLKKEIEEKDKRVIALRLMINNPRLRLCEGFLLMQIENWRNYHELSFESLRRRIRRGQEDRSWYLQNS